MKNIHFISGLPRSGSTLLSAILRQNPKYHASVTSPVASFLQALMPRLSNASEFNAFLNDAVRARVLRGVFESYYADLPDATVFDTNRTWTQRLPVLAELFPAAKMICCVRPMWEILQSFERIFAENPLQLSKIIANDADTNVFSRVEQLLGGKGLVGAAVTGLKDAFYGAFSDRLMLVSYESLARRPGETVNAINHFLGEEAFKPDFNNLNFSTEEYDTGIGAPGLHRVKPRVSYSSPKATLPPELMAQFTGQNFWEIPGTPTRANVQWAQRLT